MGFSRRDARVGSLSLLQGIFLTHESNLGLLHCGQILYCLGHQGCSVDRCISFLLGLYALSRLLFNSYAHYDFCDFQAWDVPLNANNGTSYRKASQIALFWVSCLHPSSL